MRTYRVVRESFMEDKTSELGLEGWVGVCYLEVPPKLEKNPKYLKPGNSIKASKVMVSDKTWVVAAILILVFLADKKKSSPQKGPTEDLTWRWGQASPFYGNYLWKSPTATVTSCHPAGDEVALAPPDTSWKSVCFSHMTASIWQVDLRLTGSSLGLTHW